MWSTGKKRFLDKLLQSSSQSFSIIVLVSKLHCVLRRFANVWFSGFFCLADYILCGWQVSTFAGGRRMMVVHIAYHALSVLSYIAWLLSAGIIIVGGQEVFTPSLLSSAHHQNRHLPHQVVLTFFAYYRDNSLLFPRQFYGARAFPFSIFSELACCSAPARIRQLNFRGSRDWTFRIG